MTRTVLDHEWLTRFGTLYQEATGIVVDREKFADDDLYACQVLQVALESNIPELRRVAAHVETLRIDAIESMTLKPLEELDATWKLDTLGDARAARREMPLGLERRIPNRLLSAEELLVVGRFKRLYEKEFGRRFDIELFTRNDAYGRTALRDAANSANPFLVQLAGRFFDVNGNHTRHRRGLV